MSLSSNIVYLKRKDIDVDRWDACIEKAENGLIYAYSYYLDAMCTNWDALVLGDYEAVMPLPWRKKWGIRYLYTPAFIQQLGIIGSSKETDHLEIVAQIYKHFLYGDITLNAHNSIPKLSAIQRNNFTLHLNRTYRELENTFSSDLKRNLKLASKYPLRINSSFHPELVIKTFRQQYSNRLNASDKDYKNFLGLCYYLEKEEKVMTRCVYSDNGELEAGGLFLLDKKRLYNVLNVTTQTGRTKSANHCLLSKVIEEFSSADFVFDFEGSDLPGVKEFYENFSPINQPYFLHHFNKLPFPINLLKK